MFQLFRRTIGAVNLSYYLRQFLIACLISAVYYFGVFGSFGVQPPWELAVMGIANAFLYPYSRLGYKLFVEYLNGNNAIYTNWFYRSLFILLCYCAAIIIAPMALLYLFVKSRATIQC